MRLTKDVVNNILHENEGLKRSTSYSSRNFNQDCLYRIEDGVLKVRRTGKTSWADSRFDEDEICDMDQTRRFIRKYILV